MKKLISIMALCCVAVTFFITPLAQAEAKTQSDYQKEIDELKAREAEIDKQLEQVDQELENAEAKQSVVKSQIENLEGQIATYTRQIDALNADIAQKDAEIQQTQAEIDENYELFKKRLKAMYMSDDATTLGVLFGSQTFAEFLTAAEVSKRVAEHDQQLIDTLTDQMKQIEQAKAAIEQNRSEVQASKAELDAKKAELNEAYRSNTALVVQIRSSKSQFSDDLKAVQQRRAAAEAEMNDFMNSIDSGGELSPGGWLWPVAGYTYISSGYGYRTYDNSFHKGIDIPAPAGTPVRAAKGGIVARAEYSSSYGNVVVINHGGRYSTLYAHNTSLAVSEGQTVTQGQIIAYVGNTGDSDGNHCHFELWYQGKTQDPEKYV